MEDENQFLQCSLKDCGFDGTDAEKYLEYEGEHRKSEQLRLLNKQRRKLMDDLNMKQKRVDTVDFMIREVEQG